MIRARRQHDVQNGGHPDVPGPAFRSWQGLRRELTTVLVLKGALLVVLWRLFFAHAPELAAGGVTDRVFGASAAPVSLRVEHRERRP